MPSLADLQTRMRDAVVLGTDADLVSLLTGGRDPARRLAVHRRHYEASLVEALRRKFPGVVWLVGEPFTRAAARDYVRSHPPAAPCIAEYGEAFPDSLARCPGAEEVPYLGWFARLEWLVGQVAQAIDSPAIGLADLSAYEARTLPDLILAAQPGLRFLEAPWPVDELMAVFLSDAAPERHALEPLCVSLQILGARGRFRIDRVEPGTYTFRSALAAGLTLGDAVARALEADGSFDPGRGLASFAADGLLTGAAPIAPGARP